MYLSVTCETLFCLVFTDLDIPYSKQFLGKNYNNIRMESVDHNFGLLIYSSIDRLQLLLASKALTSGSLINK